MNEKPKDAEFYNQQGEQLLLAGEILKSRDCFSKALETNAEYADAYYNRGRANYTLGCHAEAVRDFHQGARYAMKSRAAGKR